LGIVLGMPETLCAVYMDENQFLLEYKSLN
jgi:hypothetical protein